MTLMDTTHLAQLLGRLVAYESLQAFIGKNVSQDDLDPARKFAAWEVVCRLTTSQIAEVVQDQEPQPYGLSVPDDPDFGKDDQEEFFKTSWSEASVHERTLILAWYVILNKAYLATEQIRGRVPGSWDDVYW